MKTYHIPVFVPHRGCPNDCVFCNQRHITGHVADTTPEDVKNIIEEHLTTLKGDYYAEVAFFGGSFTGIDPALRKSLLGAAYPYVKSGKIHGIRCSTRPDYIDGEILKEFKEYGGVCIELGVQSTDNEVLKKSRRGHSFSHVKNACSLIKAHGIELGLQMMLGLPGDTREKMINTAKDIISLEPSCVRLYPTLVVEDTELSNMYQRGEYAPLSTEEAVEILSEIIPMFKEKGIEIIRVGLQTTDEINEDTVKGPYHPAINELAEGMIIRKKLESRIEHLRENPEVFAPPERVSQTIGHKRCNRDYFREKYGIDFKVSGDKSLSKNELRICDKIVAIY